MNLVQRVKNILVTPKREWLLVDKERASPPSLLLRYVLPLAILASVGELLSGIWFSSRLFGQSHFLWNSLLSFSSLIISFYISLYVIEMLAPAFSSQKNTNKSAQLVAYSNTPAWIAGFLSFIPLIGWLIMIAGWLYSIYIFYLGLGILKKTPEDKRIIFMLVAFIAMVAISIIIRAVLMGLFVSGGLGASAR